MICFFNLFAENDFYRSLGAHYGYFCRRPGNIIICTDMLGVHHIVRPSIRFAGNDRHFGDGGFAEGVQEFRSVLDDSPPLLIRTGKETRHIFKTYQWDIKSVTETDNPGTFYRGINIQYTRQYHWLVSYNAHCPARNPGKTYNQIFGVSLMDFIKGTAVCNPQNNIPDVVRFVWMFRYQTVQFGSFIRIGFSGRLEGYLLFTILRKIREKFSDLQKASCIIWSCKMGHS